MPNSRIRTEDTIQNQFLDAVRAADSWDVVHRPNSKCDFPDRIRDARLELQRMETRLSQMPALETAEYPEQAALRSAVLDLRSNIRLLRATVFGMGENPAEIVQLPRIVLPAPDQGPRVAAIARLYLRTVDGVFSESAFHAFIQQLQTNEPLAVKELWQFPAFLKFALLETLLDGAYKLLHASASANAERISVELKSLRSIDHTDWAGLIEPLIVFDATLRLDPAGSYALMDFESRELYRKRIAFIARHSDCSECRVAEIALDLARGCALLNSVDSRMKQRRIHIGYYIVDKGFSELARKIGYHPPLTDRVRAFVRSHADDSYITSIQLFTVLFIAALLFPLLPHSSGMIGLVLAFLLLALPTMQSAVDLVNGLVTALFDPETLPKLDFSAAIPTSSTTLVAVPSLLMSEEQTRGLVTDLEIRFLANRDPNLHFALLTDLPDSVTKPHENDSHPLVELAIQLIDALNEKYDSPRNGAFILLHRHRTFNRRQSVWMGWERKRGKLLDLNKLLMGEYDAFPIKAGKIESLHEVRYILTLDADSQLPRGAAARLIGAITHPLNQAIIDPKSRIVTAGYGILQPRIGIAVHSATRSRLAAIFSGQTGFDIYSRAISDAYQDMFGEGIFTGKGIYEVATLHTVLDGRFPRNALLSHDLIEGAYARAGLVTDVELIDDYPSHYSAHSRRKHRWVRGDWQIVQWIFSRVPEESGRRVQNPISDISRWKVFDNLRRSLVDPFLLILFVAGWIGLPGGPLYWTIVPLVLVFFPAAVQLGFGMERALTAGRKGSIAEAFIAFAHTAFVALLNLIFLAHQTLLAMDAVVRSLVRRYITGERLLEWETAAQAEQKSSSRTPVDRYLALTPLLALGIGVCVYYGARHLSAVYYAAPVLVLWALAPLVTVWLSQPPREHRRLKPADTAFLLSHTLRIWRYFEQFGAERHNFLIPDNVAEEGFTEAARVSPTNLGLLLNARQAACELGFITAPECVALNQSSLGTIARLEKYRGHLYNWYDTKTLQPLDHDSFVSSVDSGNFVASLLTLHAGSRDLLKQPLLRSHLFTGIRTYWQQMQLQDSLAVPLSGLPLPGLSASLAEWIAWLPAAQAVLSAASESAGEHSDDRWWLNETRLRVTAVLNLLRDYLPWMLPEYGPLREMLQPAIGEEVETLSIEGAAAFTQALNTRLGRVWAAITAKPLLKALGEQLRSSLPVTHSNLNTLVAGIEAIAKTSERLAAETEFAFLVDPNRKLLSIGYSMGRNRRHDACYDLLASEARIATFLAIARGDLPQQSWFKLARQHVHAFGCFILLSWTGTMFEYLMPSLWMQSSADTLLARTQHASVHVQRAFGRSLGIPWGISESGSSTRNESGHYSYHAYGVPQTALSIDATAGPVVSPYSTFLALGIDVRESLRNLRQMEAAGWVGAYGFYEAADFTASRENPTLVREWMAHHLGMSLLAVTNLLRDNLIQHWFHAVPLVQASELLLQEMPVRRSVLKASVKEFAPLPVNAGKHAASS